MCDTQLANLRKDVFNRDIFTNSVNEHTHFERHLLSEVEDLERVLCHDGIKGSSHFEFDADELPSTDKMENLEILISDSLFHNLIKLPDNNFLDSLRQASEGGEIFYNY